MFKEVFFDFIVIIIIIIIFIIIIITIIIIIDIIIDCTIPVSLITKNALAWLIAIGGTPNWGSEGSFLSGLDSIPFILFSLFSFPLSSLLFFLSLLLSWFVLSPCSWCEWNPILTEGDASQFGCYHLFYFYLESVIFCVKVMVVTIITYVLMKAKTALSNETYTSSILWSFHGLISYIMMPLKITLWHSLCNYP